MRKTMTLKALALTVVLTAASGLSAQSQDLLT